MACWRCYTSRLRRFGRISRRVIMPRTKTSPEKNGPRKSGELKAAATGTAVETEAKLDDAQKSGGVALATAEKEDVPAARNELPPGETLNLADLQAMSMPRLQKMARDGGVETVSRSEERQRG